MKILCVIGTYIPGWRAGGPIISVSTLCKKLVKLGHDVSVFTTNVDGSAELDVPVDRAVNLDGVQVSYFNANSVSYAFSWSLAKALKNSVKKFDLVHIHTIFYWPTLIAAFFCRKYKVPYVISPEGTLFPESLSEGRLKKKIYGSLIEKRNLRGAAMIHFTTEAEQKGSFTYETKSPSMVVPNAISCREFSHLPPAGYLRRKYPEIGTKQIILFMGRIHHVKGLDILVEAFAAVNRRKENTHLVIVGPDNIGYARNVRKWIDDLGIHKEVTFTGILLGQDKLGALMDADVFCLPSYHENFGMVVGEAMACGLPVVISDRVGIHSEVKKAEAGMVIKTDAAQLDAALDNLLDDPNTRKQMGKNGRRLVEQKYDLDKVTGQMIDMYQKILNR